MTLSGMIQQVLSGTGATLTIFFSTLVISLPLGLLVAFARMSDIRPFRRLESNGRGARLLKKFIWSFLKNITANMTTVEILARDTAVRMRSERRFA